MDTDNSKQSTSGIQWQGMEIINIVKEQLKGEWCNICERNDSNMHGSSDILLKLQINSIR